MAEPSLADAVRSSEVPEAQPTPPGATPMSQFAGRVTSSDLLPGYMGASAKEVSGIRDAAARQRTESADVGTAAAANKRDADAARPGAVTLPPPPPLAPRPFLAPGEGMLAQLQTAIVGATQMALGVGGLKGGGRAIAAVAGLKGALEGWQAGDHERATAALKAWDANAKKLLEEHRTRREAYQDLLTDLKMDMANRLAQIGIHARIDDRVDLANAAERGQIKDVIDLLGTTERHERDYALKSDALRESTAKYLESVARMDRQFDADQAHRAKTFAALETQRATTNQLRREAGARADKRETFREETAPTIMKLQASEVNLSRRLANAEMVAEAVARVNAKNVLPKGATFWDKGKATAMIQTYPGDQELAKDIDIIRRLGLPLLISTEIGLGIQGSQLRVKSVIEAEAGNPTGIPKAFWDIFIPMATKGWKAERDIAREHLKRLDKLQPSAPTEDYQILKDDE